jgi:Protein of unknown function (DUF3024)
MPFSEKELKQIEQLVGELCRRRSPAHLKDKLRLSYSARHHEVLVQEARPDWHNSSEWIESDIAKLRYVRASDEWRLYWKRASGKWWLYEPHSSSRSLYSMIKEIDIDSDGCFFG